MNKLKMAVSAVQSAVCASAAVIAVTASSVALADGYRAPVPTPFAWTGLYVGINAGYGWTANSSDIIYDRQIFGPPVEINRGPGFDANGGFGGFQIGYNLQQNRIVVGLETDLQISNISDRFKQVAVPPADVAGDTFIGNMHVNYFGTVRGRVGYDFGHTLVYFTGGFAYAGIDQRVDTASVSVPTLQIVRENNGVRTGFVLGGGIEYALDRSWSIKGEYQYLNLGSDSLTGEAVGLPVKIVTSTNSIDNTFHTLRLGVNYRLY